MSALQAIAAAEAGNEEDDECEHHYDCSDDQLDLHVLPPHLAAQLSPSFVESVSLQMQQSKLSGRMHGNAG